MLTRKGLPDPPWDRMWTSIRPCFERCAAIVQRELPTMSPAIVFESAIRAYPLTAYLSFMRDRAQQPHEDLVLCVVCGYAAHMQRVARRPDSDPDTDGPLAVRFFVERGNGEELAEVPLTLLPDRSDPDIFGRALDDYVSRVCAFIDEQMRFILHTLRMAATQPWEGED